MCASAAGVLHHGPLRPRCRTCTTLFNGLCGSGDSGAVDEVPKVVSDQVAFGIARFAANRRHVLALVCAMALWTVATVAQTTGVIRGEVRDPSGALVLNANVTATLSGTNTERSATTSADGTFEISALAVGTYEVIAR